MKPDAGTTTSSESARTSSDWRDEAARLRRLARRLGTTEPEGPVPPVVPPGRVVLLPGRGETFVRQADGPDGVPPVLLLHGWTASGDLNWWRAYEAVSAMAPMVAIDHRGHGRGLRSEEPFTLEAAADDAAALVEHLGIGPVLACGYSMGGPISMLLWQRHPHLVAGLVLEATALEWRASLRERIIWKAMGLVELVFRVGPSRGLVERALREAIEQAPDLAPHRSWLKAELRRGDPSELAEAGRALGRYDGRGFAGDVDVPTAVVVTTKDRLVRPGKQRALAKVIPGATVHELAADHDACLVAPEAFSSVTVAALTDVLARITGEPVEGAAEAARLT
ncbi:MAG: alpha/beta hydrolase [Acidimicrobiales bacterium]